MTTALTPAPYDKLTTDLLAIFEKGKEKALSVVNQIMVETYWQMGALRGKMGKRPAETHETDDTHQEHNRKKFF